jgi:hypothetical protein
MLGGYTRGPIAKWTRANASHSGFLHFSPNAKMEDPPMNDDMAALLVSYYHFSEETARELLTELRDTRSLGSLTQPYVERAVLRSKKKDRS